MVDIRKCDNYDEARELFIEYYKLKGAEVCFVSFENELKNLEEVYSSGVILIAKEDDKLIGCSIRMSGCYCFSHFVQKYCQAY